jgi:hypothetical protein
MLLRNRASISSLLISGHCGKQIHNFRAVAETEAKELAIASAVSDFAMIRCLVCKSFIGCLTVRRLSGLKFAAVRVTRFGVMAPA